MLNEAERRRCERLVREGGWFARVGLDWAYLAVGLVLLALALRQESWRDLLLFAGAGGFALGGSIARLFLARDRRILARLYSEWARRESAPPVG